MKKLTKIEIRDRKIINNFYSKLKKDGADSADFYLSKNDSLVKKLLVKSQNKLIYDLALAYETDKRYSIALQKYVLILKEINKAKTIEEKKALNAIINIYAIAQVTDSLCKYVDWSKRNLISEKGDTNQLLPVRIKASFLKGNFDTVALLLNNYKKNIKKIPRNTIVEFYQAQLFFKQGKYQKAKDELDILLDKPEVANNLELSAQCELLEIEVLYSQGKEKEAFSKTKKVYNQYNPLPSLSDYQRGMVQNAFANQLYKIGKYKEALEANDLAIKLLKTSTLENSHAHGKAVLLSFFIYNDMTDFGAAKLYLSEAHSIYKYACGQGNTFFDEYTFAHGYHLYSMEQYKEALNEVDLTLANQKRLYGSNTILLAQTFNLKGNIYEKEADTKQARIFLDSSLVIYTSIVNDLDHPLYGKLFNDIGLVEQKKEVIPVSIESYKESLRIFEKLYGFVHPDISIGYTNVASLYRDIKQYPKAFQQVQKALMANCINYTDTSIFSNPENNISLSDFLLLKTSVLKCRLLQEWADSLSKNGNEPAALQYNKAAIENYFFCLRIINRLRSSYVSEESKVYLTEKVSFIYEDGISICRLINKKTNDESYIDKAFAFSEKSKAGLLLSSIIESNAKKVAGLPDSLLLTEKKIISTIGQLDKDLFKELKKGNKADQEKVDQLKKQLFEEKEKQISFLKNIEKNFPKYFQLKYDNRLISIKEVQEKLLDETNKELFVEYFVGKDSIYIFCITKHDYKIMTVKKDPMLNRNIKGLTNSIWYNDGSVFAECSSLIFDQLLKPIKDQLKHKNIIVVSDIAFVGLPLQTLINTHNLPKMKKHIEKGNYRKLPFAIYKNAISYELSASVAIQNTTPGFHQLKHHRNDHRLFVLAPVFDPKNDWGYIAESKHEILPTLELDTLKCRYFTTKTHCSQLPGTEQEALGLVKVFKRKNMPARGFLGNYAQKKLINSKTLSYYNYIHFATHGEMNLNNAELSGLYLNDADSTSIDGLYHIGNVYNLELKANMVTLSTCESGLGKIINGEGIMGFTRAFTYAGAESIMVSLWSVNDPATSKLMKHFYKYIFKKRYKGSALKKAQVEVARRKKTQAPYYWAPFVLYGI